MSAAVNSKYLDDILLKGLDKYLVDDLTEKFVSEKVKEFEEELRATIKPRLDKITVENVERVTEVLEFTEELRVKIFHGGKDD